MPSANSYPPFSVWLRLLAGSQSGKLGDRREAIRQVVLLKGGNPQNENAVNAIRAELAASTESIQMVDFGAGTRGSVLSTESKPNERRISEIYQRAAAPPNWGRFMYALVRELKPENVLELGTNLGISALHISNALEENGSGQLVTIEGDPTLSDISRDHLNRLGHSDRASVLTGRFDDVLPDCLQQRGPFDLVFIDGHHEEAATLRYFDLIKPHLTKGACVAFDDIEPFRPVRKAWKHIIQNEPNSGYIDFFGIGLWFAP